MTFAACAFGIPPNNPAAPSNLPSCLEVGAQHLWNAVQGTFDPTPSLSGVASTLAEGGAGAASGYATFKAGVYAVTTGNTKGFIGLIGVTTPNVKNRTLSPPRNRQDRF